MLKIRYIRLDGIEYTWVSCYEALLPPERRQKISRLRFDSDKLLSLTAGLLIRAEVGDLPLSVSEHGKPYAVGSDKYFSVSHSKETAVIAVDDAEIGADVEQLHDKDYLRLAERFYHPNELEAVRNAEDQIRAFTRIWTRKEAYLKQLGIGIATDLRAFDTTSGELSERIRSFDREDCVISVCSGKSLAGLPIEISDMELKDLY